jgi:X-X-X-Leu-X-X-Gly heptad repeat protein
MVVITTQKFPKRRQFLIFQKEVTKIWYYRHQLLITEIVVSKNSKKKSVGTSRRIRQAWRRIRQDEGGSAKLEGGSAKLEGGSAKLIGGSAKLEEGSAKLKWESAKTSKGSAKMVKRIRQEEIEEAHIVEGIREAGRRIRPEG